MIDLLSDMNSIYSKTNAANENSDSFATIQLDNGMLLYFSYVNQQLALVCLIRKENFEKQGLMDYNFRIVSESILELVSNK